jgi:hypothetical protein
MLTSSCFIVQLPLATENTRRHPFGSPPRRQSDDDSAGVAASNRSPDEAAQRRNPGKSRKRSRFATSGLLAAG